MQRYDHQPSKSYNTTFALAQFLTTTGPEDYSNYRSNNRISQYDNGISFDPQTSQSLQTNKMKFFDRLRKKSNHNNSKFIPQQEQKNLQSSHQFPNQGKAPLSAWANPSSPLDRGTVHKKHIPLLDDINQPNLQMNTYQHQQKHPSFYEAEDNSFNNAGDTLPSFPTPPASSLHESEENQQQVSSLLFSSSSSSLISESSPAYTPTPITRSKTATVTVNQSHKKGIRRGSRHIQVQTEDDSELFSKKEGPPTPSDHPSSDNQVTAPATAAIPAIATAEAIQQQNNKDRCDLCSRPFNQQHLKRRQRRGSCPAVLASGAKMKLMGHEAGVLLALIDQLKQQLVEEQQSRKLLEKAIQSQWLEKN
ncbi:hypothetical protein BCR42DRAFT_451455 [Absidia repens]|uniref:Uncharacterized protein n=1 Tax=Absidia repens TaxID=90262 RepID=A0A1X2IHK0_9FUNG|nr:hypothetical protein BCR42DRAFT_451455 [Absidia repens]